MDPGAKLQRPQPQQRGLLFSCGATPHAVRNCGGVGVVHRRPDGRSSLGASRGAKQKGAPVRAAGLPRAAPGLPNSPKDARCFGPRASGSGARGFDADIWGAGYGGDVGRADRYASD
jgi:hypothetical protein